MPRYRLKVSKNHFDQIRQWVLADIPKERGAFALAGCATHAFGTDIIVRRPVEIPQHEFALQEEFRLEVSGAAVNGLISLCEVNRSGAVLCHSHPTDTPYSPSDDFGERRVFDVLRRFVPDSAPTASLLFHPGGVRGRVWPPGASDPEPLSEIAVIGRNVTRKLFDIKQTLSAEQDCGQVSRMFSRQILAFGEIGQRQIQRTRVAIVGLGGTGSAIAEQLARLGSADVVLIDPDRFNMSNLTRMYGSFAPTLLRRYWPYAAKRSRKVDIVAKHLRRIQPEIKVTAIASNVVRRDVAMMLRDRDVIFLCTDDHWGRSIVNEVCYQYLIPTINVGMRIAAKDYSISAAVGVVDVLRPGLPCLWCRQSLSAERITAESMPSVCRNELEAEGYVENLDSPTPSVVSITTTVSSLAVTTFLQLTTDFMEDRGNIVRLNYNVLDGTVRRGRTSPEQSCVCNKIRGLGDLRSMSTVENLRFLKEQR